MNETRSVETRSEAPLRMGVIGIGWAGQQHLEALSARADVEVVALAGMEAELLGQLADKHGVASRYERWEDLLDSAQIDAVVVAVPTALHAPIAIAALERGLHVLCEKPIAESAERAEAMVAAARKAGRVLEIAFNHRRRGDIEMLKGVVDRGELGRIYYAKAWWLRRSGIPQPGSWFTRKESAGGGPLVDIGIHVLDFALHLMGEPAVTAANATTFAEFGPRGRGGEPSGATDFVFDVEDFATALLRLEKDAALTIETSWAGYRAKADEIGVTLYGTEGGAELVITGYKPVGRLRVFKDDVGPEKETELTAEPGRGHAAVAETFVATVLAGPDAWPAYDGSLALSRARIIDACYESARTAQQVEVSA
ncbi:Gfo/Idh/MocA family protein [Rugosimonospora africana]|uniref:Oxidoreductase n=1 Tax=Rugosimonospora africana TaxID=556532 RepID=A0A8J3R023_9ACTN|nr:Gfo/Idh/MocA family oxidoreductase [Rugosimonospora africana]GIH19379.1 oxidoreductase [Rugosimonospora africana]